MDQIQIGKLIAECRKNKKMTQAQLAKLLGVTDKSVSKWENGICLPDVSLYKDICELLGITLNEFFAGMRLSDETFKEIADENLFSALENSIFTLKDKIDFFKKKWEREHFFVLILGMLIIVFFIIYGFIKDNGFQYLFMMIGFISGIIENNRKMAYIERNAYGKKSKISLDELRTSIKSLKEFKEKISEFKNKEDAIHYLMRETGLSKQDCLEAYNFAMKTDFDKIVKQ